MRGRKNNWVIPKGEEYTPLDRKVLSFQAKGYLCPSKNLIRTPEEIEGIRKSGVVNTGVLDLVAEEIHAGMTTLKIDRLVYDYTVAHGAVPATKGFRKVVVLLSTKSFVMAFPMSSKCFAKETL